jgi:N utilization substance protein B
VSKQTPDGQDRWKERRQARAIALQILYEIDLTMHEQGQVIAHQLEASDLDPAGAEFVRTLVRGVLEQREVLDEFVVQVAPEWPLAQMAPVDRNILRLAIYELRSMPETPLKVAINEAVELAKRFGSDSSRRFVNGALGTFVSKYLER